MEKGQVAQSADCARIRCVCVHMERRTTMMVPPAIGSDSSKNAWDPSSSTSASNWKNSGPTGSVGGSSDWCGVVKASADVNNSAWSQSRTTQGENSQSVCSSSWSEIARKSINTAPPAQSNPIGSVINPAKDCNYEMGTGNWGKPVDQGTPWDVDSSMIWNNPYPKKNTMPDKGTAIWGDPAAQGEIKRWKNGNEDAHLVCIPPNPAPCTSAGAPSTSSKVATQPNACSVWKDSPIAPQPVKPLNGWGSTSINSPYGGLNATGVLDASSSWMNDAAAASGQAWNNDAASAKPGTSRQDVGNRRNVDSNLVGDDIFASHMIPGPSTNCDNSMALAHQVAEKLNIAMRTGHIDSTILNQPLPQETLLKLRQLLQCITKLEQSKIELQHLQTLEHNGTLNAAQQQEYRRLAGEVNQLRLTARNLRSQFSAAQQTSLRKNTSSNDVTFGCSMPTSDLPNQSKLMVSFS
ncbi:hypothetical protein D917_09413 [Trichinella nativa]|uniref:GW182 middle domain-containing protein n=1 Tax=Trichinella nativa TaxID=6335 RepID=A0A1Y3EGV4_9BILA|nr:hypothetical protein D917_09413 [Trichinella nativa]